jgi:hypothetical protein
MASLRSQAGPRSGAIVPALLLGWFAAAFAVGASGWFRDASAPAIAIIVWSLTLIALLFAWRVPRLRHWASNTPLRGLISVHITRFVGIYFLILYHFNRLPYAFAVPGGVGDTLVATTALILFLSPALQKLRPLVLVWNGFGLVDIVFVVATALRVGLHDWQSMAALRELPLMLLPTFLVPLIIVSHILIFIRTAQTRASH